MKITSVKCPECGSTVDMDIDHLKKFCGHCGSKLVIDIENVTALLIERERTKQYLSRIEAEKEIKINESNNTNESIMLAIGVFVGIFLLFLLFISDFVDKVF